MRKSHRSRGALSALVALAFSLCLGVYIPTVHAQDTLKVAAGQRGNWDTSISEIGQRAGIFKKHGLVLEILWTQGGGETQQAVISGSVDIGIAPGIMGVLSAYSKGAPVRIIGAETTGASDLYWYVPKESPIKSLKDTDGKTISYSTVGSSTHGIVMAFMKQYDLKAKPTATGGPAPTLTQVMTNQIDVGWSAPPFGLQQLDEGKIRIIAQGNDATVFKGQTVRLVITNTQTLTTRKAVVDRYMKAYRETIDWLYSNDPAALKTYADFVAISIDMARRTRDDFFPRAAVDPDKIVGLDTIVPDAVTLKFTAAPLTKEQLAELIQIPSALGTLVAEALLDVRNITKRFATDDGGIVAVDDVSFSVAPGEFVSIIGPSGCGKSTLFNIIGGLTGDYGGQVSVEGETVSGTHPAIGMVFQEESTFPWRTVLENVAFPLEIAGMGKVARRERAAHFVALVGLTGFERRYPAELSGGMRQRVAIARTLASEPRILLMDEPFAALDEQTRLLLGDKVLQIQQALKQTTLLITHNLTEAVQLSDRVLVMTYRPGRLKRSVAIDLPHPRDSEVVSSEPFGHYVAEIWQDLREEASRGIEDAESRVRLQVRRR